MAAAAWRQRQAPVVQPVHVVQPVQVAQSLARVMARCLQHGRLQCSTSSSPPPHTHSRLHTGTRGCLSAQAPAAPRTASPPHLHPNPPSRLGFGGNEIWQPYLALCCLVLFYNVCGYLVLRFGDKPRFLPLTPAPKKGA